MDKEQIIIDGIDVSGCEHHRKCILPDNIGCKIDDFLCCDKPNCYFKQLQKEKFENLNNRQMVESAENLIYENSELIKNLEEKKQECEELKEENQQLRNNLSDSLMFRFTSQDKQINRYREALEEIEEYINNQGIDNKWNMRIQRFRSGILNIISKAKDGE